ncbi:NADH-ubiquinone oxidoreductase chain 2 (mitochondrion) [Taphrina deformans PYCC 5710]|uniref:NADH-ubiquinone oxidoreductase chain 2 n=1 Tax=Taphrina deformans (strain PYCC 5710 / ATCC 11124 / CBS 356.35 / IMI 108563 / JCM 9778 / NBRC 8474) TaxID=1097556 RepID=M5EFF1_TAPDE|nr:NADH-ubiquinone oxidoreductase chain 2 [Taphrina deformans PYCC 5710]|eukprot:CCV02651.1 NADH-ubiquinone oxidoreductase chain 2 (mitochondrion) [Taphrina deformans PYCC 5710]
MINYRLEKKQKELSQATTAQANLKIKKASMLISGLFILLFISAISAKRINGIIINRAAALILLYSFILSIYTLNVSIIGSGIGVFGGLYQVTVLSKVIEGFIYLLGAMILSNTMFVSSKVTSNGQKSNNKATEASIPTIRSEYSIIALFTVVGGILLITSNDLVSMYLSIELQSFGLYVLATIYRDSQAATSAGLKYFLLGGLSSGFILLGSSIIYAYLGVTNLESIYLLMSQEASVGLSNLTEKSIELSSFSFCAEQSIRSPFGADLGLLIMTVGFLFKVASAPFHNWAPDVYDGVPTKVTTWLAIMAKISILTFLLDLVIGSGSLYLLEPSLSLVNLMLIASFLSLLVGTIVGLAQSRIKRLLAYSTISHVGFLLLAIAINTEDSIESFIFYLIQYSLTSANAFFVLIAFGSLSLSLSKKTNSAEANGFFSYQEEDHNAEREYSPIQFIAQLKGQFNALEPSPLLALSMAIILFSMAGIPPLVGFFAKQAVLLSAVKNGFIFLVISWYNY